MATRKKKLRTKPSKLSKLSLNSKIFIIIVIILAAAIVLGGVPQTAQFSKYVKVAGPFTLTPAPGPQPVEPFFSIYKCQDITSPGIYTVYSDLSGTQAGKDYCLGILTNNVELNCNSHTLNGNNAQYVIGILLNNANGARVKNCVINNYSSVGIYLKNSDSNTISGNTINGGQVGISLNEGDDFNNVIQNTVKNGLEHGSGIVITGVWGGGTNNIITKNTINSNYIGINLGPQTSKNTISSNIITNGASSGIYLSSSANYNTVISNTVRGNKFDAIHIQDGCIENTIKENTVENNIGAGIMLFKFSVSPSRNIITKNIINNNSQAGIDLFGAFSTTVDGNTLTKNLQGGIRIDTSYSSKISQNIVKENLQNGILVHGSSKDNVISNNIIENNDWGINVFPGPTNTTLSTNRACNNNLGDLLCQVAVSGTGNTANNVTNCAALTATKAC